MISQISHIPRCCSHRAGHPAPGWGVTAVKGGWGNWYESPLGRFFWLWGDLEAQLELVFPNSSEMPPNHPRVRQPLPLSTNTCRALLMPR